jgi:hypothetical protein
VGDNIPCSIEKLIVHYYCSNYMTVVQLIYD